MEMMIWKLCYLLGFLMLIGSFFYLATDMQATWFRFKVGWVVILSGLCIGIIGAVGLGNN